MSQSASVETLSCAKVLTGERMTAFRGAAGTKSLSASISSGVEILAASNPLPSKELNRLLQRPQGQQGHLSLNRCHGHPHQAMLRFILHSFALATKMVDEMSRHLTVGFFLVVVPSIKHRLRQYLEPIRHLG
ncbi:hypothetical protein BDR07DRAFT_1390096 [Suillus spraguei]|nr:hypothetical protein BDR07DRAFT_1390096 [Suillus spraguei]